MFQEASSCADGEQHQKVKLFVFDFDNTLSVLHVFKALTSRKHRPVNFDAQGINLIEDYNTLHKFMDESPYRIYSDLRYTEQAAVDTIRFLNQKTDER